MITREGSIKMKNKPNVTDLAGEKVMVDFSQGKYFMLKGSANDIWGMLEDGVEVSQIVTKLLEIYDVEKSVCEKSVDEFLTTLVGNGFIEIA